MKLALLALAAMCAVTKAYPADPLVDGPKFLECIAMKEQNGHGNLYGITAGVWHDRMEGQPYSLVGDPFLSRLCALKHLNWLAHEIDKAGVPPDCYALAAAWNVGLSGFLKLRGLRQTVVYGQDVANLYASKP